MVVVVVAVAAVAAAAVGGSVRPVAPVVLWSLSVLKQDPRGLFIIREKLEIRVAPFRGWKVWGKRHFWLRFWKVLEFHGNGDK